MLYAAWQVIACANANQWALMDLAAGRRWTFRELAEAADALPAEEPVVYPSGAGVSFVFDVLRAWHHERIACPLDAGQSKPAIANLPQGCVHVKTSSGSAGPSHLVAFTGAQLAADAQNIVATMGLRPNWPNLAVISLAHSYGFSNLVLPLLLHGIPLALAPSRLPEALRSAARQFSCLTLPAVPALWRVWRDAGAIPKSVKLAISAGAAFPATLEREIFERDGVKVHNFYGASECGGICYDAADTPRHSDDDVGAPLRGVSVTTDSEGRLVVCSKAVGETYWPEPDAALANGTFRVADRAEIRDGRVFLLGRHGDMINVAGQKVAPENIEQTILRCPGVAECVVFGAPDLDSVRAETIVACVSGDPSLTVSALKEFATHHLPPWQNPRHWWILPALSDPIRGKISRAKWRERFLAGKKF